MEIHSLGYRTDLIFAAFDGEITPRRDYLVIRSPANPTYYWGNFLLFAEPPKEGDYVRWCDLFAHEIGTPPQVEHQTYGWDSTQGEEGVIQPFRENGYRLLRSAVLAARQVHPPPRLAAGILVRPLVTDEDWEQAVENQVVCREPEFTEEGYRTFKQRHMQHYRAMGEAGIGDWYGAFTGERLVADLGIFQRDGLGRYQSVQTHPDYRRRGIAGRLVYESAVQAMAAWGIESLVIVADAGSKAEGLYKSVGFEHEEVQMGLEKWEGME